MKDSLIKTLSIATMIGIAIALCCVYYNVSPYLNGDGLAEWRSDPGTMKYEIIYQGRKYYCDRVETLAGHPERLVLHRGRDHMLLPDKYAVHELSEEISKKKETIEVYK
jgi:hypothetical protein